MYRKTIKSQRSVILDLDSLMDILSCLVGVMLFLVMYTVLELGSAAYQAEVLVSKERPPLAQRVVVVADEGTVRVLDARGPLAELLSGFEIVRTFQDVQTFVDAARRVPADEYFEYRLRYVPRATADPLELLSLEIREREGAVGDSIHRLGPGSRYVTALERLDPQATWIAFAVDSASGDIFRRAREIAIARGFATGFDELDLEFPLTLELSRSALADLLSPLSTLPKPQR
jgi:hypothetical protein